MNGDYQLWNQTIGVAGYWIYLGRLAPSNNMLVEQSYHMDSDTGNWAQGDKLTFNVDLYAQQVLGGATPPAGELPGHGRDETPLDSLDIGDATSESGHNLIDWSNSWKLGDNGNYGGGDDGDLRLLMGHGDGCGEDHEHATFTMNAGTEYATKINLRHLDGSQDDSFDVYVAGVKIGHYEFDGNTAEEWKTTTFNFSTPQTGVFTVKLVSTDPVAAWCTIWGQVAFSQADILR